MSMLLFGDCLEELKSVDDESIDLIFCDLPYVDSKGKGATSCSWNQSAIDLDRLWIEIMRVKKLHTPIFFTTTTKFGVELITSAPKKCYFRYDIVWVKSSPAGFLSAKKMPMRKHELIYVFYEKLPFYDLSSHKHKFLKEEPKQIIKGENNTYNTEGRKKPIVREKAGKYETPLPVSVVKEEKTQISQPQDKDLYGASNGGTIGNVHGTNYDPPLPHSLIKEEVEVNEKYTYKQDKEKDIYGTDIRKEVRKGKDVGKSSIYDPPLPNTMLEIKSTRGNHSTEKPVALMEWFLKYYSKEGDVVLDPTMGSGSTGVACKNMNRNFIGIEKDPEIYEVAVNRIEK